MSICEFDQAVQNPLFFFLMNCLSICLSLKVAQNSVVSSPCPDGRLIDVHVADCITYSLQLEDQLCISKVIIHEPSCQMDSFLVT